MEVNNKYQIGQKVFFLDGNGKAVSDTVNCVMKKATNVNYTWFLKNSQVFQLGNFLVRDFRQERTKAFKRAYLVRDLLVCMSWYKVQFAYVKENGEVRQANGTLNPKFIPEDKLPNDTRQRKPPVWPRNEFRYYDLDKQGWRTFKATNLHNIENLR